MHTDRPTPNIVSRTIEYRKETSRDDQIRKTGFGTSGDKNSTRPRNYEWNLERVSNSSQSTHPIGRVLWKELLEEVILHITPIIAYVFKGQVHVFAGRVKIVSHSSCRTGTMLKYFCPLDLLLTFYQLRYSAPNLVRVQNVVYQIIIPESP